MKFKVSKSTEGWFGFGSSQKEEEQEDETTMFYLYDYVVSDVLDFLNEMSDDDFNALLERKLTKVYKPQTLIPVYKSVLSRGIDACCKRLVPKWKVLDKFFWTGEQNDPVDWSTKTIKNPALAKALQEVGKVSRSIVSSTDFLRMIDWTNDDSSLVSGTMAELGYNKNLIKEMVKLACLVLDERNQEKLDLFYVTAEGHRDGWNRVVNHVFWKYYNNPSDWPDLQAGEKVFLATSTMLDKLSRQLSKFLVKFAQYGNISLD